MGKRREVGEGVSHGHTESSGGYLEDLGPEFASPIAGGSRGFQD